MRAWTNRAHQSWPWHILVLGALGAVWEVTGRLWGGLLFPTATDTVFALARLGVSREFWAAMWASNQALLIGFALALVAGVSSGLLLARWSEVDRWLDVYVGLMFVVPKAPLMPLVIMTFGLGLSARSLVVFAFAFPTILVTVRAGAREVDRRLLGMARSFCASEAQIFRRIMLPGALPSVMTAVRLGLAQAVGGMVTVELLLVAVGVGQLILTFRSAFDPASLYATLMFVVAEAVLLVRFAEALERRLGSWSGGRAIE